MSGVMDIDVSVEDTATPFYKELAATLQDRTELHSYIAPHFEQVTRDHLIAIAPTMHKTARRLGAKPTGYLTRRANAITSGANRDEAFINLDGGAEIFARVAGPVVVRPVSAKNLAIPNSAKAYGKRPRELAGLKFIKFKTGSKALVEFEGKGKARKMTVHYWLKDQVTLPEERDLLPSDEAMTAAMELGAVDFFEAKERQLNTRR